MNFILIDGSYYIFYRYHALRIWWGLAKKEGETDDYCNNPRFIEKFRENHVRIPDTYIGIARVLITLGGLLMHYKVPFDWTPPEQRTSLKART